MHFQSEIYIPFFNDFFSNFFLILRLFFREIHIWLYSYIYENYKIVDLPYDNVWTYVIAMLFIDMAYYWFHRAAHGNNILLIWPFTYSKIEPS